VRRRQSLIRPLWRVVGDGCHPDRETGAAIAQAEFAQVDYQHFAVPVPIVGPHIAGRAVK
jgi:hypothetical protein